MVTLVAVCELERTLCSWRCLHWTRYQRRATLPARSATSHIVNTIAIPCRTKHVTLSSGHTLTDATMSSCPACRLHQHLAIF
jgi:hypothetical protein